MTPLETTINRVQQNVAKAKALLTELPLLNDENFYISNWNGTELSISTHDAILAGKVFGKSGWVRKHNTYASYDRVVYDWTGVFYGVLVMIHSAEKQESMNDVPVAPSSFPLQIEESNA